MKGYGMDRLNDYESEGKKLLLRALTAMVERVELGNAGPEEDADGIVRVYRALVSDWQRDKDRASGCVTDAISDAFLSYLKEA